MSRSPRPWWHRVRVAGWVLACLLLTWAGVAGYASPAAQMAIANLWTLCAPTAR